MFTVTTPSMKSFEITLKTNSLPLPEDLSKTVSKFLKADIDLTTIKEVELTVDSTQFARADRVETIKVEYSGKCSVYKNGRYVTGKIRFIVEKTKFLGFYERL